MRLKKKKGSYGASLEQEESRKGVCMLGEESDMFVTAPIRGVWV